jgi:hypothetical protein
VPPMLMAIRWKSKCKDHDISGRPLRETVQTMLKGVISVKYMVIR